MAMACIDGRAGMAATQTQEKKRSRWDVHRILEFGKRCFL